VVSVYSLGWGAVGGALAWAAYPIGPIGADEHIGTVF